MEHPETASLASSGYQSIDDYQMMECQNPYDANRFYNDFRYDRGTLRRRPQRNAQTMSVEGRNHHLHPVDEQPPSYDQALMNTIQCKFPDMVCKGNISIFSLVIIVAVASMVSVGITYLYMKNYGLVKTEYIHLPCKGNEQFSNLFFFF